MNRPRIMLGLIAGFIIIASSGAHSLLGWPRVRAALAQSRVPADLVSGLAIGWHFGGASMLTFGCIVVWLFVTLLRGGAASLRPAFLIALLYMAFGIWAFIVSDLNPYFFVFTVPGLLLAAASWSPSARQTVSLP
jgi:hypothetical protein